MENLLSKLSNHYKHINICNVCMKPGAVYICQAVISQNPYSLCSKAVCIECGYKADKMELCLPHRLNRKLGNVIVGNVKDHPLSHNIKTPFCMDKAYYVYIGRRIFTEKYSFQESVFRNERVKKDATNLEKLKNLARYLGKVRYEVKTHGWIWGDLHQMKGYILAGYDVVLLCWCAPGMCHGNIVRKVLLELVEEAMNVRQ